MSEVHTMPLAGPSHVSGTAHKAQISCKEAGRGHATTVVFLHGVGSGSASWSAQLDSFGQRYHALAWDAPGYGDSDALAVTAPTAANYGAALASFLDDRGVATCHLIGHSLGALIAASFAADRGARVAKLVLASPTAGFGKANAEIRRSKVDARLADMEAFGPKLLAERRAAALLSSQPRAADIEKVRAVMSTLRPEGYAQAVRMLGIADIFADAPRIACPALVLCGDQDRVTPLEGCRNIAAALPGARFALLNGVGHASYVEDPVQFDAAVMNFLET